MEFRGLWCGVALLTVAPIVAHAQQVGDDDSLYVDGVLIRGGDVTDCPYRVVQPVSISVTEDYDGPNNREKIRGKFLKEAKRIKADAIVKIERGDTHMTAWAWSRREYHALAVRYVDKSCAPMR